MKKLAIIAALAAATFSSYAQKAVVQLNNYNNDSPVYYLTSATKAPVTMAFEVTSGGAKLQDPSGNALTFTWSEAGYFDLSAAVVPGATPGSPAELTFKAWNPANTAETVTATWTQATANWAGLPSPADGPNISLPTGTTIVASGPVIPEPTTIALGLVGAAALLLRRRQ